MVLKQCHQLRPEDSLVCLYAAKLCFNSLHMVLKFASFINIECRNRVCLVNV